MASSLAVASSAAGVASAAGDGATTLAISSSQLWSAEMKLLQRLPVPGDKVLAEEAETVAVVFRNDAEVVLVGVGGGVEGVMVEREVLVDGVLTLEGVVRCLRLEFVLVVVVVLLPLLAEEARLDLVNFVLGGEEGAEDEDDELFCP